MKIGFIYPQQGVYTYGRNWLWWVADKLKKKEGVEEVINDCHEDTDVMICMAGGEWRRFGKLHGKYPDVPIITYVWDWLSFIDKSQEKHSVYRRLMKEAKEVWTCTKYQQDYMEKEEGIRPDAVIYSCSVLDELDEIKGEPSKEGYALMASRRDPRYKRFGLFERGCKEVGVPSMSCHPPIYPRKNYLEILRDCNLLVVATCEDANAALSSIEAAWFKKPLLLSDIPPHKEEWEDYAAFFKTDDLEDFKDKVEKIYTGEIKLDVEGAYKHAMEVYTPEAMATRIYDRLNHIFDNG